MVKFHGHIHRFPTPLKLLIYNNREAVLVDAVGPARQPCKDELAHGQAAHDSKEPCLRPVSEEAEIKSGAWEKRTTTKLMTMSIRA